ncbi:MAG TPA: hypothetical protein VH760_03615 [Gaiellaceae bacterium]|jgi:hypothetical protein
MIRALVVVLVLAATAAAPAGAAPAKTIGTVSSVDYRVVVTAQLLVSPSLGCGRAYRIGLA